MFGKKEELKAESPTPVTGFGNDTLAAVGTKVARLENRVIKLEDIQKLVEHDKENCICAICGRQFAKKWALAAPQHTSQRD
jgi:hypothetical protein